MIMKKYGLFFLSMLLILACSTSDLPFLAQPTLTPLPPPPTFTLAPAPTITDTPTEIILQPTSADTDTPTPTDTPASVTPTSSTPMTPSVVANPALACTGFQTIDLSATEFHFGDCSPSTVTIIANVSNPAQVSSVVLFLRYENQATGTATRWGKAISMKDQGLGTYLYSLNGNKLNVVATSWVQYQIVATDKTGNQVARSPVFASNLILSPCP